jgi:DNA-3-methyladenine glycosylase II
VRTSRSTRGAASVREAVVPVRSPYRLDLTAIVLRRLSTNVVDAFDGRVYQRLLGDPRDPVRLRVEQTARDALAVRLEGAGANALDPAAVVRRVLGTERDLDAFAAGARRFRWLEGIARAARGVKPPRYPSLWETVCNAVVYQQVSIHAAGAILRRVIERYAFGVELGPVRIFPFPTPQVLLDADPLELRDLGLSIQKITALKRVAAAIDGGELDEEALETLPTPQLIDALVAHRGIGPWTAAVIALRGFGRLDIFPMKDSGAEKSLRRLSGDDDVDVHAVLDALAPQQGMLYYHLLLSRLRERGEIAL